MFGGVADAKYILNNDLTSCIAFKLYNCYCKKDNILKYLLRTVKWDS